VSRINNELTIAEKMTAKEKQRSLEEVIQAIGTNIITRGR
tara:strand:+ start:32 stop:151 length:120 start_codon:yes stop_codon:yes gene_type:complete